MIFNRVLITGANGLLGQELVAQMSRRPEYDLLATSRDTEPRFAGGSCGYVRMDLTDCTEVRRVFQDFAPDVVINTAAMTLVDECETERERCWEVNVDAVSVLAKCCLTHGSRLIQVSTDFIFDGEDGPYREAQPPSPISFYGKSKWAAENAARGAGLDRWAVARTVLVYGTGERLSRSNIVLWVIDQLSKGNPIHVVTDQWRTPTYVADLAQGIEKITRYRKTGVFHISGRELLSIYEFALLIAEVFDLDAGLIQPADHRNFVQKARRPARTGFIILKAETELGYAPHAIRDALIDMGRRLGLPVVAA